MKSKRMIQRFAASALLAAAMCGSAHATNVAVVTKTVPPSSDAVLSLPVTKAVAETATVSGVAGAVVSVDAVAGSYATGTHYVRVMDGPAAGLWSTIDSVSGTDLTLASTQIASQITQGATVRIYPHCTIEDIFPSSLEGTSFNGDTSILIFDNSSATVGQNPLPTAVRFLVRRGVGSWNGLDGKDTVIAPDTTFVVRNGGGAGDLQIAMAGFAPDYSTAYYVPAGVDEDLAVGTGYPVSTTIGKTTIGKENRSILLFDYTTAPTINPLPTAVRFLVRRGVGSWTGLDGSDSVLPAGDGFTFRFDAQPTDDIVKVIKPY